MVSYRRAQRNRTVARRRPARSGVVELVRSVAKAVAPYSTDVVSQVLKKRPRSLSVKRRPSKPYGPAPKEVVYRTKGFRGPRFKKGRRVKTDWFKKRGSEIVIESGNQVTDGDHVAVGHSTIAAEQILDSICRALIRHLVALKDVFFSNWDDTSSQVTTNHEFTIGYITQPTGGGSTFTYIVPSAGVTFMQMAVGLRQTMINALIDGTDNFIINNAYSQPAGQVGRRLELRDADLHIVMKSHMMLQNRTLGAATSDNSALDVTNNPIVGRSWDITGNQVIGRSVTVAAGTSPAANPLSSVIRGYIPTSGNERKVQAPGAYNYCKRSSACSLKPGEIRRSYLGDTFKGKLNTFMKFLVPYIADSTLGTVSTKARIPKGKSRIFEFEKLCDTTVGLSTVDLGYEINYSVKSYITPNLPYSNLIAQRV